MVRKQKASNTEKDISLAKNSRENPHIFSAIQRPFKRANERKTTENISTNYFFTIRKLKLDGLRLSQVSINLYLTWFMKFLVVDVNPPISSRLDIIITREWQSTRDLIHRSSITLDWLANHWSVQRHWKIYYRVGIAHKATETKVTHARRLPGGGTDTQVKVWHVSWLVRRKTFTISIWR